MTERTRARHASIGRRGSGSFRTAAGPAPHDDQRILIRRERVTNLGTSAHAMGTRRATDSVQCKVLDLFLLRDIRRQPARLGGAKLFRDLRWRHG